MDSLITSAIALAAGGWQNVKLAAIVRGANIYSNTSVPIPTSWKLGICSINSISSVKTNDSDVNTQGAAFALAFAPSQLVTNGTEIYLKASEPANYSYDRLGYVKFTTTEMKIDSASATAVLFTWD